MSKIRATFYGDDFTGSVDALLQFARRGWSGRLFVGIPSERRLRDAAGACDVVGIAGIARSLSNADLDAEVRPALTALAATGAPIVQYKACSTADSSPTVGSIGRAIEIGREVVGAGVVPVLFAQPDFGRFTAFSHHFAAERGTVYRLDRQPTMSTHPSTPMTESDLTLHLRAQTSLPVSALTLTDYSSSTTIAAHLQDRPDHAVVLDALTNEHLDMLGVAIRSLPTPVFAVGSGGLSTAIAGHSNPEAPALPTKTAATGPVLAVSGSRSSQTRRQMDAAAHAGWLVIPMPVDAATRSDALAKIDRALSSGRSVALSSDDLTLPTHASEVLDLLAETASAVIAHAVSVGACRRFIVCGGDTSSRVTTLLGIDSLSIVACPRGNIVLLRAHAQSTAIDGIELLLKGGQVGDVDLFDDIRAGKSEGNA
ncbi:uncharacterized protein YgbK (DUF1537 family) [Microbacterium halimionae]|uniref:Uncharacterized protein YgbK (DUF1537 family) n=1 Tax=Microbacterium halimionae TaxID=1526413 RepID=A0A7W3JLS8_9MICO|nr:four-carbon acid sugar kinase family protein [Microbacterium halimionae]MBA8815153.1 uncharacterized protein YgbK (DUF1537 family) [Microbacterium halimionae]NII94056.1 uncharacterized protein YgbK (DUF1537 family) [Microbacterium halimionae]